MKQFIVALIVPLVLIGLAAPAAGQSAAGSRKPNIVMIVADDLGYADVGCHEQSKDVKTPHIDSIAADGVRFTNGYVSGPVCSPTRAGLLTGRYQQRFGFEQNPLGRDEERRFGLPPNEITIAEQLKKSGYATAAIGKWHLGHKEGMHPQECGFDEFFGFLGGAHRYLKNEKPDDGDANAIQRNGKAVGEKQYLTHAFTREAISFIERNHDKPFFLYLPYNAVHSPMQAPEKYLAMFSEEPDQKRRAMLAMLASMDDGIGQVLATLREHKLDENTLVIFFSDNGGPTKGNGSLNAPFRGHKGDTLEGGIRVPFMLRWTGKLPAGEVDDRMIIQLDLFPTILAAAGGALPEGRVIDGKNLIPYLENDDKQAVHETLYWRFGPRRAIRSGNWKLHWNGEQTPRLYDLSKDIGESNDLAATNPQIAEQLMATYKQWDAQMMDPAWPGRLEGDGGDSSPAPPGKRAPPRRKPAAATD